MTRQSSDAFDDQLGSLQMACDATAAHQAARNLRPSRDFAIQRVLHAWISEFDLFERVDQAGGFQRRKLRRGFAKHFGSQRVEPLGAEPRNLTGQVTAELHPPDGFRPVRKGHAAAHCRGRPRHRAGRASSTARRPGSRPGCGPARGLVSGVKLVGSIGRSCGFGTPPPLP